MKKFITLYNKIINETIEFFPYKDVFIKIDKASDSNQYKWKIFDIDVSTNTPGVVIKESDYLFDNIEDAIDDAQLYVDEMLEITND